MTEYAEKIADALVALLKDKKMSVRQYYTDHHIRFEVNASSRYENVYKIFIGLDDEAYVTYRTELYERRRWQPTAAMEDEMRERLYKLNRKLGYTDLGLGERLSVTAFSDGFFSGSARHVARQAVRELKGIVRDYDRATLRLTPVYEELDTKVDEAIDAYGKDWAKHLSSL